MPVQGDNSLFFASGIDTSGLLKGTSNVQGIISGLASKIAKINPFVGLAVSAVTVFGKIAFEAFQFAKQYETAMLEVRTISNAARADFDGLKGDIFDLSKETLDDPIKLAQAYYQVVSAGYDGAEGLRVLEVASRAAVAGVTETEVAADGITTVLNAFGLGAENAEVAADAMFKTVELGKTNFEQLSRTLSNAAPTANALGVSFQEVLAATATLTKQGVPTSVAMTQIRAALIEVNNVLGDSWSNAYTFQEALEEIFKRSGGSQQKLRELVPPVEAFQAVLALAGENAAGAAKDLDDLANSAGAANSAFNEMTQGQNIALGILRNRVRGLTEDLGDGLLSVANDIAQFLLDISDSGNFAADTYRKETVALQDLRAELQRGGVAQERRVAIIQQLKQQYPSLLQNIEDDQEFNSELALALTSVNDQLLKRIRLEENKEEIAKQDKEFREATLVFAEKETQLQREITKLRRESSAVYEALEGNLNRSLGDQVDIIKGLNTEQSRFVEFLYQELRGAGKERLNQQKELNALLGEGNEIQKGIIAFDPGSDGAQEEIKKNDDVTKTYEQQLQDRKRDFEAYEAAKTVFGEEEAKKRFAQVLKFGDSYRNYLAQELGVVQDFEKLKVLAVQAASEEIDLTRQQLAANEIDPKGLSDGLGNFGASRATPGLSASVKITLDEFSVSDLRDRVKDLTAVIESTTDEGLKRQAVALRAYFQERLNTATKNLQTEGELYDKLYDGIYQNELNFLLQRRAEQKKALRILLREEVKNAEKIKQVRKDIDETSDQIDGRLQTSFDSIIGFFNSASGLFSKFGNEELAQLTGQLAGVAQGAQSLAAGFASNDPLAIAAGIIDIASSALTIEISSDTEKFEKQMKSLRQTVSDLDRVLEKSIGIDRISTRTELIEKQKELEEAALNAAQAEEKARKEVRFLGIKVADKGEGSGTDPEKIRELEEAAKDARDEVFALEQQIKELFTGTTSATITDSLLNGFEEGKKGAEDFADTFEELMRNAVLESLKLKFLEKAVQGFFDEFASAAESDGALTADEISDLRERFNALVAQSEEELAALNQILGEAGIAGVGQAGQAQGLSGEIETITEETANVLAGTLNKIMIDTATSTAAVIESNLHLAEIHARLASILEVNTDNGVKLTNIEKNLS